MRSIRPPSALAGVGAAALLALASGSAAQDQAEIRWRPVKIFPGIVDVVGPRADGRLVVAATAGLWLHRRGGRSTPFARGPGGYMPAGGEPYVALAPDRRLSRAGCSFRRDDLYALVPTATPRIARIDRSGQALRFADLPAGAFPSGIGFDTVGRFGYRLLVTALFGQSLTVYALDCRGRSTVVLEGGPRVEGGIAVAPRSFGRFAGHLIAADEHEGRLFAIDGRGRTIRMLPGFRFPYGGDVGIESVGFVPPGFDRRGVAYLADLLAPSAPSMGTNSLLTVPGRELARAGVRPGDLLVASESRAITFRVRCARGCTVHRIGRSEVDTHAEGHLTVVAAPRTSR